MSRARSISSPEEKWADYWDYERVSQIFNSQGKWELEEALRDEEVANTSDRPVYAKILQDDTAFAQHYPHLYLSQQGVNTSLPLPPHICDIPKPQALHSANTVRPYETQVESCHDSPQTEVYEPSSSTVDVTCEDEQSIRSGSSKGKAGREYLSRGNPKEDVEMRSLKDKDIGPSSENSLEEQTRHRHGIAAPAAYSTWGTPSSCLLSGRGSSMIDHTFMGFDTGGCASNTDRGPRSPDSNARGHIRKAQTTKLALATSIPSSSLNSCALDVVTISSLRQKRTSPSLPLPIPVPNLTKGSRGRDPVTMNYLEDNSASAGNGLSNKEKYSERQKWYLCDVDGCGRCFTRGEHLKRHVRSLHTHEKPHRCPYPGCERSCNRLDNLKQHMQIHEKKHSPLSAPPRY